MSNKAIISALNKVLTEQLAAPPVVRPTAPAVRPTAPVSSTPRISPTTPTAPAVRSTNTPTQPLPFGASDSMNPGLRLEPTRSSRKVETEPMPTTVQEPTPTTPSFPREFDRIFRPVSRPEDKPITNPVQEPLQEPFKWSPFTPSIDMPIVTTTPTTPSFPREFDRIFRPVSRPEDKPTATTPTTTPTTTPDIVPDALPLTQPTVKSLPIGKNLIDILVGLAGRYLGQQTPPRSQKPTKGKEEKDLTGPTLLNLKKLTGTPQYKYDSTKFAAELNPIFQRETGSQAQISKGEGRKAFKVPVEESQKPGGPGETKPQIREFDTINPEPQMPRGKDTLMGDPTPTEIAAKMRDVLIRQRSLRTKEKYSSRANENPPIKNIDHSAIHHPQIDGPINPGTA